MPISVDVVDVTLSYVQIVHQIDISVDIFKRGLYKNPQLQYTQKYPLPIRPAKTS